MAKKLNEKEIHQKMANQFADLLEDKAIVPWQRTFKGARPRNLFSDKPYQGYNMLYFMMLDEPDPYYVTFNQAKQKGGSVKKGARSKQICFFQFVEKDKNGKRLPPLPQGASPAEIAARNAKIDRSKSFPFLTYHNVFHARNDCEGLEHLIPAPVEPVIRSSEEVQKLVMDKVEEFQREICPMIEVERQPAYYPSRDVVGMPSIDRFMAYGEADSLTNYAHVLFHEYGHATGHPDRLARRDMLTQTTKGSDPYAFEEMIAEYAVYLTMGELGLETKETKNNTQAYLQGWARNIRENPNEFISASFRAVRAYQYLIDHDGIREKAKGSPAMREELKAIPDVEIEGLIKKTPEKEEVTVDDGVTKASANSPDNEAPSGERDPLYVQFEVISRGVPPRPVSFSKEPVEVLNETPGPDTGTRPEYSIISEPVDPDGSWHQVNTPMPAEVFVRQAGDGIVTFGNYEPQSVHVEIDEAGQLVASGDHFNGPERVETYEYNHMLHHLPDYESYTKEEVYLQFEKQESGTYVAKTYSDREIFDKVSFAGPDEDEVGAIMSEKFSPNGEWQKLDLGDCFENDDDIYVRHKNGVTEVATSKTPAFISPDGDSVVTAEQDAELNTEFEEVTYRTIELLVGPEKEPDTLCSFKPLTTQEIELRSKDFESAIAEVNIEIEEEIEVESEV